MSWSEILEHEEVLAGFRRAVARGRLASTFLFVGPAGIGKRTFAIKLAQSLLCEINEEQRLEPCGNCASCTQVAAGTHPDLELVSKPVDKAFIPLELFIGDKEHRNREGLCHRIALKPMCGRRKIAIIDDADHLNVEGANCLLKTLEEPPPRSLIILIGTSVQRQLPTIRSRSQVVRFGSLRESTVEQLLQKHKLVETPEEARTLSQLSGGSLEQALGLQDEQTRDFRLQFLGLLPNLADDSVETTKQIIQFVDAAGKEAPPRRARLKAVANWAVDYYRQSMRSAAADDRIQAERAAKCLDRCVRTVSHVDANANLAAVVEAWIDDLAFERP